MGQGAALTADEFTHAVIASADAWGDLGNAGTFTYIGTTSLSNIPRAFTKQDCDANDVSSIVVIDELCPTSPVASEANPAPVNVAYVWPRCHDTNGNPTRFEMHVRTRRFMTSYPEQGCVTIPWSLGQIVDDPWNGAFDLRGVLTHEFGHTLGLPHPVDFASSNPTTAVMSSEWFVYNTNKNRSPREYDLACLHEVAGSRARSAYARPVVSGTVSSSEAMFTGTWSVARVSPGRTFVAGVGWRHSAAVRRDDCFRWTRELNTANLSPCIPSSLIDPRVAIGVSDVVWPERDIESQRIFYGDWLDQPSNTDKHAAHRLRYARSSSEFAAGTVTGGGMSVCTSMTGFMTCSATEAARSPLPSAHAYLGEGTEGVSVTAWVHATVGDGPFVEEDNRLRVAIGSVSNTVLPESDLVPRTATGPLATSQVAPGLACAPVSPYACLLAYVPVEDRLNRVRVKRFNVTTSATRHHATFDTADIMPVPGGFALRTGSRLAVWRSGGYFFIAAKSMSSNQQIFIARSTDGNSWTSLAGTWGQSQTGPTVGPTPVGTENQLVRLP